MSYKNMNIPLTDEEWEKIDELRKTKYGLLPKGRILVYIIRAGLGVIEKELSE